MMNSSSPASSEERKTLPSPVSPNGVVQFSPRRTVAYVPRNRSALLADLFYTNVEIDHFRQEALAEQERQQVFQDLDDDSTRTSKADRPAVERVPSVRTLRSELDKPRPRMYRAASERTLRSSKPKRQPTKFSLQTPPSLLEDSNASNNETRARNHHDDQDNDDNESGDIVSPVIQQRNMRQRAAPVRRQRASTGMTPLVIPMSFSLNDYEDDTNDSPENPSNDDDDDNTKVVEDNHQNMSVTGVKEEGSPSVSTDEEPAARPRISRAASERTMRGSRPRRSNARASLISPDVVESLRNSITTGP